MGGRGASNGEYYWKNKDHVYGDEYRNAANPDKLDALNNRDKAYLDNHRIKYVRQRDENESITAPLETRTQGRIYATIDAKGEVKHISFYDRNNKRYKTIDVFDNHKHLGYNHNEYAKRNGLGNHIPLNIKERMMTNRIIDIWRKVR